jgi:TRAP-type C4-dicarboxylate transport system permease small subunit
MKLTISAMILTVWAAKIHLQRAIVALCGVLLTLIIFILVIGRYVFNVSFLGIEEVAVFVAMWFYFLGGAIGSEQRGHITASVVDTFIYNEVALRIIAVIVSAISLLIAGWMTLWAWEFASWSHQMGMRSMELGISMSWVHMSVPLGLGLMTLYTAVELVEKTIALKRETKA